MAFAKVQQQTNIHTNLRILRVAKKMNQRQFATYIGIKRARYACWEDGRSEPPLQYVILLSKLHKVSVDELIGDLK